MLEPSVSTHSISQNINQLIAAKIPILDGRGSNNNLAILEQMALNGPLLKYDIFKNLSSARYSTISRRIDDLTERGYIDVARKRLTGRGKRLEESMYGLKWKGFVASLSSQKTRQNIVNVLRKNPLLALPEKETILLVIEELTTNKDLEIITQAIFEAYLEVIPNIETIREDQLWVWLLAIRDFSRLQGFRPSRMPENVLELLDRPPILKVLKEKVAPFIQQQCEQFEFLFMIFKFLNDVTKFVISLDETAKPSEEIKKYIENYFSKNSQNTTKR